MEKVVQTTLIHLDNALKHIKQQMSERFDKANTDLEHIRTILDNEKHIFDSIYESIMNILTKLSIFLTLDMNSS